jgi:hypothetical protein
MSAPRRKIGISAKGLFEKQITDPDEKRKLARDMERTYAKKLGAGKIEGPVKSESMSLDQMLERFVYLAQSNEVCDLTNPRLAMNMEHFRNFTASSGHWTEPAAGSKASPRWIPAARGWLSSQSRQRLDTRTWLPGANQFTKDPHGMAAVNIWTPTPFDGPPADWKERVKVFLEHVEYLMPVKDERERFLDWFAHVEQYPGEIVHSHYLFVAPKTQGIGRNWLGSLAARLWPGNVALSVNLKNILEGRAFNAELSEKYFAVVDELHEGSAGRQWALAEALKSELTREQRRIKPKYGKEHDEFNRLRWLMLSNELLALPLTEEDRRFWVIENPSVPRSEDYYGDLYSALNYSSFIASVRHWLRERDLAKFNPGARPVASAIKVQMIESVKSDEERALDELVTTWPAEIITQHELQKRVFGDVADFGKESATRSSRLRAMLARVGGGAAKERPRWNGKQTRVAILRNRGKWFAARPEVLRSVLLTAEKELPERAQEVANRPAEKRRKF